jgi:hypothetical protein
MRGNSNIVRHFVTEVLDQGKIESTGESFWEDMVEQVALPGQGPGLSGLRDVLRGMRAAIS